MDQKTFAFTEETQWTDENSNQFFRLFCLIQRGIEKKISEKAASPSSSQKEKGRKKATALSQKWDETLPLIQEALSEGLIKKKSNTKSAGAQAEFCLTDKGNQLKQNINPSSGIETFTLGTASTHEERLAVLEKVQGIGEKNSATSDILLRSPLAEETPDWVYHVPSYFNKAMGISLQTRRKNGIAYLEYVQSGLFAFETGYVFYTSKEEWKRGMDGLQIKSATPVSINDGRRHPGSVSFTKHPSDTSIIKMTQDDFVEFLILGVKR